MTKAGKEAYLKALEGSEVQQVLYIHYLAQLGEFSTNVFIDSNSEVNEIQLSFVKKLGLNIQKTIISAHKIDNNRLKIYKIIIVLVYVDDKDRKYCFFEETYLLADISIDIACKMFFLTLSNVEVNFYNRQFRLSLYMIAKIFSITRQVELVKKREFAVAALDPKDEIFVVHVTPFAISDEIYSSHKVQIASFTVNEALTTIFPKYFNFTNVFFSELTTELFEYTRINNYAINLVDGKQSLYELIFSLGLVELKSLKIYMKTYLVNTLIRLCEFLASALIFYLEV